MWVAELAANTHPPRFALKGFNPDKARKAPQGDARALFEREIGKWLRVGLHLSVLPALGLELVPPDGHLRHATRTEPGYPLVRMPFVERTMADLIGDPRPSMGERLSALAQLSNGLSWIYEQGISGHGDLKPENVLLEKFPKVLRGQEGEPQPSLPTWRVRVADLGWAEIWKDFEGPDFARKAYRPYLAPERLEGEVRDAASDIFAVGVIAVELLTARHPAGPPTSDVARWDGRKYSKWAREGLRLPVDEAPLDIRALLDACLAPRAEDRPRPEEIIDRLCRAASAGLRYDLKATLSLWTEHARQSNNAAQRRWALEELARVGGGSLDSAIEGLEVEFDVRPLPASPPAVAKWLTAGRSLTNLLLRRGLPQDRDRAGDMALQMLRFVVTHFDDVDLRYELYRLPVTDKLALSDLEAAEVMFEFGSHAENVLAKVARAGEVTVSQLRQRLRQLWKMSQPTPEEFIEKLLLRGIERSEEPNGGGPES